MLNHTINFYTEHMSVEDLPAYFFVEWGQDDVPSHPDGPSGAQFITADVTFNFASIGDMVITREVLIDMIGEDGVGSLERNASGYFEENYSEYGVVA